MRDDILFDVDIHEDENIDNSILKTKSLVNMKKHLNKKIQEVQSNVDEFDMKYISTREHDALSLIEETEKVSYRNQKKCSSTL